MYPVTIAASRAGHSVSMVCAGRWTSGISQVSCELVELPQPVADRLPVDVRRTVKEPPPLLLDDERGHELLR